MIRNFKCKETEKLYKGLRSKKFPTDIHKRSMIKLNMLEIAEDLLDLKYPPSNHLEALQGDRKDQYSIRINAQYRICFSWLDKNAYDVEIVDYH